MKYCTRLLPQIGLYSLVVGQFCKQVKYPGGGGVVVSESPGKLVDVSGGMVVVVGGLCVGTGGLTGPGFTGDGSTGPGTLILLLSSSGKKKSGFCCRFTSFDVAASLKYTHDSITKKFSFIFI